MGTQSQRHCSVFISYKSEEASVAYQVRAALLSNGISCWMAPDSIPIGSDYGNEIPDAIAQCEVFLLLLSECAQKSVWIAKELDLAITCGKPILPIHLDKSALTKAFNFRLSNIQRVEAFGMFNKALDSVIRRIQAILGVDETPNSDVAAETPTENRKNDAAGPEESLDAAALYERGEDYYYGRGVEQDYGKALKWYRRAAEQGHADAQFSLGVMYRNGQGIAQDDSEAVKWYRLAAEQGHAKAQNNLGLMYDNGQGVPQDYGEAVKWYRRAAEQGHANAQNNLGVMYEYGQGIPQNYGEAVKWYRLAAGQGNANAQYNLGDMYEYGKGVSRDYGEALKWYELAAEQGHAKAKERLLALKKKM